MKKTKKRNGGFTLVELIIVIAILAILAGIAIPAYSGYIKKANKAADEMLLGALNTAFAAASIEAGQYDGRPTSAAATLTDGKVTKVTSSVDADGSRFAKYFAGNENSKFKVYTSLVYNRATGNFKGATVTSSTDENGVTTYNYNIDGVIYSVTSEQLDAIRNSTYGAKIGMDVLLGDISGMVDSLTNVLNDGAYVAAVLNNMGMDLEEMGIEPPYNDPETKAKLSNAVVLAVAGQIEDGTATSVTGLMNNYDTLSGLVTTMQNATVGQMVQQLGNITSFYAMATAFAGSDAAEGWSVTVDEDGATQTYNAQQYYDLINRKIAAAASDDSLSTTQKASKIMSAMAQLSDMMMEDGSFNTQYSNYITSQLGADASGFEEAMQAVAANSDALVTSGALSTGYNTGNISGILNMIFGIN